VAILAGRYDAANLATARNAHQMLSDAGHAVEYIEVAEGHNSTTWRDHLRDVLVRLFRDPDAR
jgi:enterochelin esterase-like enzyme